MVHEKLYKVREQDWHATQEAVQGEGAVLARCSRSFIG